LTDVDIIEGGDGVGILKISGSEAVDEVEGVDSIALP